jgi:hypothetical protein
VGAVHPHPGRERAVGRVRTLAGRRHEPGDWPVHRRGFLALTIVFLLDLPIGQLWPVALIILGLGMLLGRRGGWGSWG